jgi:hypothetical protein
LTPLAPPTLTVEKTADPLTRPEPGGDFTFTVVVTNTTARPLTLTRLVDDVYGDLNGRGSCAVGATLAANGGTYTCSFVGPFTGRGGDSQTDTVTATAVDSRGNEVSAQDTATVRITPVPPPPPPPKKPPLVRTGLEGAGPARLAAVLVMLGALLVVATRTSLPSALAGGGSAVLGRPGAVLGRLRKRRSFGKRRRQRAFISRASWPRPARRGRWNRY